MFNLKIHKHLSFDFSSYKSLWSSREINVKNVKNLKNVINVKNVKKLVNISKYYRSTL